MNKILILTAMTMICCGSIKAQENTGFIGKNEIKLTGNKMTPEALWAMGRIGATQASPNGKSIVYQVGYYSVKANKGHQVLYVIDTNGKNNKLLTTDSKSETDASWIEGGKAIAFLRDGEIWKMNSDGTNRIQLSHENNSIEGYSFSPDGNWVLIIKQIPYNDIIKKNPDDLPLATGRLVTDMNYRHWDEYVETIPHPFLAQVNPDGSIGESKDIMGNEPFECPVKPFGGIEQLAWSPDSKCIAYTSRKKTGVEYAVSTDTDIYLYCIDSGTTTNLCKPENYKEPEIGMTKTMKNQEVNSEANLKNNPGYDQNPKFSPDGKYMLLRCF